MVNNKFTWVQKDGRLLPAKRVRHCLKGIIQTRKQRVVAATTTAAVEVGMEVHMPATAAARARKEKKVAQTKKKEVGVGVEGRKDPKRPKR